ncbi:hypothetical protein DYH09_00155 [bacterium CPR1]|nr:hypothetical protein [bacterium CPR1]
MSESELDLRLEWREEEEAPAEREDRFQGEISQDEGAVTLLNPTVEGPRPDRPEEFEYSEHRARALERALGRLQGITRPPFVAFLAQLKEDLPRLEPAERQARLDGAEAWLSSQLAFWQVGPVENESAEQVQAFSDGLSAGGDALGLGLEVVELLRAGELTLVDVLLEQIESSLTRARESLESGALAASHEPEPAEPPPATDEGSS